MLLMSQLRRKHSEARLSAFQVLVEIFDRSHQFRTLVIEDLQNVLVLVLETDHKRPLPPPKEAKNRLKTLALNQVQEWVKTHGGSFPKLHHAYNFLRQVKRVSFNAIDAQRTADQREAEKSKRLGLIWKQRTEKVRGEMDESLEPRGEFEDCVLQLQNCLELLLPSPEHFLHDDGGKGDQSSAKDVMVDESPAKDDELPTKEENGDELSDTGREHGFLGVRNSIRVTVESPSSANHDPVIVENLKDQYTLLNHRLIPRVKKWIVILTKAGNEDTRDLLKKAIDAKVKLEDVGSKAMSLMGDVLSATKPSKVEEDEDDDDFEEVPDKIDYEQSAETDGILEMVFLKSELEVGGQQPQPGPSKRPQKQTEKPKAQAIPDDPEAAMTFLGQDDVKPTKVLVQSDSHRFWGSARDEDEIEVPGSSLQTVELPGEFKPVKWSCRAPLPSGRLCPRQDRQKCPLHGPVIARDPLTGLPVKSSEPTEDQAQEKYEAWNDPELLQDIEQATGQDLGSSSKGKGRGKRSGLTNIQEVENTTRRRLEKKLFNRSAMKRVAESLDKADSKRTKDKFSNQFNYLFTR